jgi:hypothetical protein
LRTITRHSPPRSEPGPPLRGFSTVVVDIATHYAEVRLSRDFFGRHRTSV